MEPSAVEIIHEYNSQLYNDSAKLSSSSKCTITKLLLLLLRWAQQCWKLAIKTYGKLQHYVQLSITSRVVGAVIREIHGSFEPTTRRESWERSWENQIVDSRSVWPRGTETHRRRNTASKTLIVLFIVIFFRQLSTMFRYHGLKFFCAKVGMYRIVVSDYSAKYE